MKRILSLVVSLGILGLIYLKIPVSKIVPIFAQSDWTWLVLSLGMVVPLTCATAWRLDLLMPAGARLGFAESNRLILAASVLNLILPSKMGDVAKAWFMKDRGHMPASRALALVVYEKTWDMLSLLLWCVFGLVAYPQKDWLFWGMTGAVAAGLLLGLAMVGWPALATSLFGLARRLAPAKLVAKLERLESGWAEMLALFQPGEWRTWRVAAVSVGIWFLHLLQIWLFVLALHGQVPLLTNLALAPLAILAGLLPLTMAGIGPRDAALIYFYHPYLSGAAGAALGLLCTMRYVLPAAAGATVMNRYLPGLRAAQVGQKTD
jgi:uncharacterized membrane protein YbhN (UPF0104 family)